MKKYRDVAAALATTLDLTRTTHIMAVSMEWTALNSGGLFTANNLTRPGEMGACMFSTSARVIRTPVISIRFCKAGMLMGSR